MKDKTIQTAVLAVTVVFTILIFGFAFWNKKEKKLEGELRRCQETLADVFSERDMTETYLARLDLDLQVPPDKKRDILKSSHAESIVVTWPDGRTTKGLETYVQDLGRLFAFAPDARLVAGTVRFGSRSWTCVLGEITGTFTKPMTTGRKRIFPPTGKSFRLPMTILAHWENDRMIEKSMFWDNRALLRQIGLAEY
ncbi:MAG: ester cyclase [Ignavibacteriales bacterium]|nr:ester cyclase [Ignavibacteriales bacterium]